MKAFTSLSVISILAHMALTGWSQVSSESTIHRPSDYVQPFDLNLMRDVTTQKQKIYDERYEHLSVRLKRIRKDIERLDNLDAPSLEYIIDSYNALVEVMQKGVDLTDNTRFYRIDGFIDSLESTIDNAFNEARSMSRRIPLGSDSPANNYPPQTPPRSSQNASAIGKRIEVYAGATIREGAEIHAKEVAIVEIKDADQLTVLGESRYYYRVKYGIKSGYVDKHLVKRIIE